MVLVQHGETEWSRTGRHTGRTDIPLTLNGRHRAALLGPVLADWRFVRVLTSPLERAVETCQIAGMGGEARIREDLAEWDYGAFEGRTTRDIRAERPGWSLFSDGAPGGETPDDVGRRADRVIDEAREAPGDVAIFAHGHILRVLAARWMGLAPAHGRALALGTGAISVLGWERETAVILRWNDLCHLRSAPSGSLRTQRSGREGT